MLLGADSLSPAEELEIKRVIRAQKKYVEYSEIFDEIDQHLLTTKREGLTKDLHTLSLYNACNRDIDMAKKAALKAKQPEKVVEDLGETPSLNFAYSPTSSTTSIPTISSLTVVTEVRGDVIESVKDDKSSRKKKGCCTLL